MTSRCSKTPMVEPWFDRRSEEVDDEMVAHLGECAACRAEKASLEALRRDLGATLEPPNAFVMKRLRHAVMTRANGEGSATKPAGASRRLWVFAAMAATLLLGAFAIMLWISRASDAMTLTPSAGARFSTEDREGLRVVKIDDGSFAFDVRRHEDGRRLLVVVPDGEIEDIGTRFTVVVHHGVTTEIGVSEGEVEFRRKGAAAVRLIAGMTYRPWSPEADASAAATASSAPKLAVASSSEPATTATTGVVAPSAAAPSASAPKPEPVAAAPSAAPRDVTAPRAAAATARDDGVHATRRLPRSAATDPSLQLPTHATPARTGAAPSEDPAAAPSAGPIQHGPTQHGPTPEDAAYMRVVRLLRSGSTDEARAAARAYLDNFPDGLRRREVEAVAAGH